MKRKVTLRLEKTLDALGGKWFLVPSNTSGRTVYFDLVFRNHLSRRVTRLWTDCLEMTLVKTTQKGKRKEKTNSMKRKQYETNN